MSKRLLFGGAGGLVLAAGIGGLFKWHSEQRHLVSGTGENTNAIHSYDDYWGD